MAALIAAYQKIKIGGGQVVGVVGEAGVGKSRLILEMRNRLPQDECTMLEGRCIQYGSSMAYLPILDFLKHYFEIKEGNREVAIKKKLENKIVQLDERLKNSLSPFQDLLSVKIDQEAYLQLDPTVKKLRKFEAIRDLLIRESENKILVIVIEDLHWMDKISGEFLNFFIDSLPGTRIMLILLYRPEYNHQWGSKSYYTKIGLDQLGSVSGAELVQAILEDGLAVPELKDLVLRKAGGNPLFVEEFTHSLLENGFIQKENHEYVLTQKASDIEVPDTIQGIIAARLDRVEESLKRIMQVASVIGREFAFRILQSITGMKEDLKTGLLNLQGLEFIYEKQLFPELEYIFKHALTQEVAYSTLLSKRKKEIHEKIGHVIEDLYAERLEEYYEVLAYHYERSDNKAKSVEYLYLANQKAEKASAIEDARGYFDKAMQILDTMPDTSENQERRISLLSNQLFVFEQLFQIMEYYNLLLRYEPLAAKIKDTGLVGSFFGKIGVCEMQMGSFDKALHFAKKAVEFTERAGNFEQAARAFVTQQACYLVKGDFDKVFALKKDVLRMLSKQFNLYACIRSFAVTSLSFAYCGRWAEAIKEGRDAITVSQQYSDNSHISLSAWAISSALAHQGDLRQAIDYGEMAVKTAPSPAYGAYGQCSLSYAYCRAGEFDKGIGTLDFHIQILHAKRFMMAEIGFAPFLAEGYLLSGNHGKAEQTARQALEIAERCGARFYVEYDNLLLGEALLETNLHNALPHLEKCIPFFKEIKAENMLAKAYATLGRFHKKKGDVGKAKEYLTKALSLFEHLGTLIDPDKVKKELAELKEITL